MFCQCTRCQKKYKCDMMNTQAYDCACFIVENKDSSKSIYGGYGSQYDLLHFEVLKNNAVELGIICDSCITELLEKEIIVEMGEYNAFGN